MAKKLIENNVIGRAKCPFCNSIELESILVTLKTAKSKEQIAKIIDKVTEMLHASA